MNQTNGKDFRGYKQQFVIPPFIYSVTRCSTKINVNSDNQSDPCHSCAIVLSPPTMYNHFLAVKFSSLLYSQYIHTTCQ
jgi:hypothetical protein